MSKDLQEMLFDREITDINLFGHTISWSQAVYRVVIVCPSDLLAQVEQTAKTTIDNWANENGFNLIDVAYASKKQMERFIYENSIKNRTT